MTRPKSPLPEVYTASQLQKAHFSPVEFVVEGLVPEGLTMLAGKPKIGKSWMGLDMVIANATGGMALTDIQCEEAPVLYFPLEDNPRRLRRRMNQLMGKGSTWPARLHISHTLRRLDEGGLEDLAHLSKKHSARFAVIDTYNRIRPPRRKNDDPYIADYQALAELHQATSDLNMATVIVHHVRKQDADDPLDLVIGSTGLTAAVDTVLVLKRDGGIITLFGRGRDIEEDIEVAVELSPMTGRWRRLGSPEEVHRSDARKAIIAVLEKTDGTMTPKDIAAAIGRDVNGVTQLLFKMKRKGEVRQPRHGRYARASV